MSHTKAAAGALRHLKRVTGEVYAAADALEARLRETEAERDALRAEVDRLRRRLGARKYSCDKHLYHDIDCEDCCYEEREGKYFDSEYS